LLDAHPFQIEFLLLIAEALFTPKAPCIDRHRLPGGQSQIGRQQPTTDFAVALFTVEYQLQDITLRLMINDLAQLKALPNLQWVLPQFATVSAGFDAGVAFDADDITQALGIEIL